MYIKAINELVRNKNNFSIEIDGTKYIYCSNETQYGRINPKLCLNNKDSFCMTKGTEIRIPISEGNIPEVKLDENYEKILKFIIEFAGKKNLNTKISEIYKNFQESKFEIDKQNFSSIYSFNPEKNNNIYSRAWSIIYALSNKKNKNLYQFLLNNYFEKEKNFFEFVEKIFISLKDERRIPEIVEYFKKRFFYYNKKSFLSMKLFGKNIAINNLSKEEIKRKIIDIRKEIVNLEDIEKEGNLEEQKYIINDLFNLKEIKKALEEKKIKVQQEEDCRRANEKLKNLYEELKVLKVQKVFEIWKEKLMNDIYRARYDNTPENMIKKVEDLEKDYKSLETINKEKMSLLRNNIDWNVPEISKDIDQSDYLKLYDLILKYNSSIEVITKIDKKKLESNKEEIIKISSNIEQKYELKSLIKYIISFENIKDFDFEYAKEICRASLMLNLYKNNIPMEYLSNFFYYLNEKKKRYVKDKNNKNLENEFLYIYIISGNYDLNMKINIPKFKPNDLIHLFFTYESQNKYYLGPIFDKIEELNNQNLIVQFQEIRQKINNKDSFKDTAGKIALYFYKLVIGGTNIPEMEEGEEILKYIQNMSSNSDKSSDTYKKLNTLIDAINLGSYLDKYKINKPNITFEDFICFKDEFDLNSIRKINNMPSFQYFLIKNYNNIEKLLKIVTKENINKLFEPSLDLYIPFWAFIIRIMSSTYCLLYENNKNPFKKELTEIIRDKIIESMENKLNSNLEWINLITDGINFDNLLNKKIQIFYRFFNKVCLESFPIQISNYIKSLLTDIYKSLFEIILSSKFNDLLNEDIHSNKYPILDFVKNPKEYLLKYINTKISQIIFEKWGKSYLLSYSESLEKYINIICKAKIDLKEKVEKLEKNLKIKGENDYIKRYKEQNKRDINVDEKKKILKDFIPQKIFFGELKNIDNVSEFLNDIENLLNKNLESVKKLTNNSFIQINDFNIVYNNLKTKLDIFDSLYKVKEDYCDDDFKNYLSLIQKKSNNFKNDFCYFSNKYNSMSQTDFEDIDIKDFSLPILCNKEYYFYLNDIRAKPNVLAKPIIIKKDKELFCNYKKIFYNTGPLSPELFNEPYILQVYSLVNECLDVEIEEKIEKDNKKDVINTNKDNIQEIIELYDTDKIKYMKLKKNKIEPNTSLEIVISFPPPNNTKKEITYRLNRNLVISLNTISIKIIIEIIFIVYPIIIDFSCEQYSLYFENEQYKLNTKILVKDEIIKFKIQNNYEKIPFILKSSIKSLDKNSCDKPEIQINQNDIYLKIKQNENDIDILNCILDIYISENIKISILINSIIISTYFDFYIYDYETKEFIMDKNYIYIPSFEDKVTIELNFLVNTFNGINQVGLFNIEEISEGITVDSSPEKIEINSNEIYFKKKLTFDMEKFDDKEIAIFKF